MKLLKDSSYQQKQQYRHLKKYWKLLQANALELNNHKRIWYSSFKDHLTTQEVVDKLFSYFSELKRGYIVYQEFLSTIHWKNTKRFQQLLQEGYTDLLDVYQSVIRTFKKYQKAIYNALMLPYWKLKTIISKYLSVFHMGSEVIKISNYVFLS